MSKYRFYQPNDPRFLETKYIVEATHEETYMLWEKWERYCTWEQDHLGHMYTVGTLKDYPVVVTCFWNIINGVRVLFYEATSLVVHYKWVEEWIYKACGEPKTSDNRRAWCNATNFAHALHFVQKESGIDITKKRFPGVYKYLTWVKLLEACGVENPQRVSYQTEFLVEAGVLDKKGNKYRIKDEGIWAAMLRGHEKNTKNKRAWT